MPWPLNKISFDNRLRSRIKFRMTVLILVLCSSFLFVSTGHTSDERIAELKKIMQSQIGMMTPELQKKVKELSPKTQKSLMSILAMHDRYSDHATLRQVMLEVLAEYQTIIMGMMTDSREMTADAARRLANHRIPLGGLLPYMGLENITDERLSVLEAFNETVEGNAIKLAEAADKGDMTTAATLAGTIASGCVGCHSIFRPEIPGKSDLLR